MSAARGARSTFAGGAVRLTGLIILLALRLFAASPGRNHGPRAFSLHHTNAYRSEPPRAYSRQRRTSWGGASTSHAGSPGAPRDLADPPPRVERAHGSDGRAHRGGALRPHARRRARPERRDPARSAGSRRRER